MWSSSHRATIDDLMHVNLSDNHFGSCHSILVICVEAENRKVPTDNVNLTPFARWRSAYFCLLNVSNTSCPNQKYVLNEKGWLNVSQEDGDEFCKRGGCADHTRVVLECVYEVKPDYWFANKATIQHLNETINIGCNSPQGFNGTSLYPASGYKKKSISIFLSMSAFVFIALF
ncbi:hypothetical protein LguiA_011878 [Lonicera macranthoides]